MVLVHDFTLRNPDFGCKNTYFLSEMLVFLIDLPFINQQTCFIVVLSNPHMRKQCYFRGYPKMCLRVVAVFLDAENGAIDGGGAPPSLARN